MCVFAAGAGHGSVRSVLVSSGSAAGLQRGLALSGPGGLAAGNNQREKSKVVTKRRKDVFLSRLVPLCVGGVFVLLPGRFQF